MKWIVATLLISNMSVANEAPPLDGSIGCFDVGFSYDEWSFDSSTMMSPYSESLREEIIVEEDGAGWKLVHFGIVADMKMRHWQEVWSKISDGVWKRRVLSAGGELRYECDGVLEAMEEGSVSFKCGGIDAPMPRRDRLAQRDYDSLIREHELIYGADGFVDVQKNLKSRDGKIIGRENGWNHYRRIDSSECETP